MTATSSPNGSRRARVMILADPTVLGSDEAAYQAARTAASEKLRALGVLAGGPRVAESEPEAAGNEYGVPAGTIRFVFEADVIPHEEAAPA